ncbi:MAG: phage baseplate assembly protein V [Tannerellaceae bacterium]
MIKLEIKDVCTLKATAQKIESATAGSGFNAILSLLSLSYRKKVYQPGRLEIILQVTSLEGHALKCKDIITKFKGKTVNYYDDYTDQDQTESIPCICSGYYVFDVFPKNTSSSLEVTLIAYSPDKYLTLDKYSKAYTGKKLVENILMNELKNFCLSNDVKENDPSVKNTEPQGTTENKKQILTVNTETTVKNLRHISYSVEKTTEIKECIFPYLVQYNESFYDFLVRTANRCGEFLYYENGSFYLGLPESNETIIDINDVCSVSAASCNNVSLLTDLENCSYNYCKPILKSETTDKKFTSKQSYNPEVTDEDYATSLLASDVVDKDVKKFYYMKKEDDYIGTRDWVSKTWISLNKPNLILMCTSLVNDLTKLSVKADNKVAEMNEKKWKLYLKPPLDSDTASKKENFKERGNGNYLFSSSEKLTSGSFYRDAFRNENEASNNVITIDMESRSSYVLLLGNKISFENTLYIISEAEGAVVLTKTKFGRSRKYVAIPLIKESAFPPVSEDARVRQSSAQTAFVVDNDDPLRLNRVRIRYPWQSVDVNKMEDASPWIRVSMPMASTDSGFNFIPEVDDEVLVDFENGNVERPYVTGSLYYMGDHKPKDTNRGGGTRSITSKNGHRIIFSDPKDGGSFVDSFFPFGNLVSEFTTMGSWCNLKKDDQKKLAGGLELTDEYGIYSIKMSSNSRSISIDSPFGKVDINAFTGININAPNGDIKITGKNVTIEAGNNLTIKSGTNIANGRIFSKPFAKDTIKNTLITDAVDVASKMIVPFDLALLRCALEAIIRPIGGTMLIKSNRYMCLETGKGLANIVNKKAWSVSNFKNAIGNATLGNTTTTPEYKENKYSQLLKDLPGFIETIVEAYKINWTDSENKCSEFIQRQDELNNIKKSNLFKREGHKYTVNPYDTTQTLPDSVVNINLLDYLRRQYEEVSNTFMNYKKSYNNLPCHPRNFSSNSLQTIYDHTLENFSAKTKAILNVNVLKTNLLEELKKWCWLKSSTTIRSAQPVSTQDVPQDAPAPFPSCLGNDKRNLLGCVLNTIIGDLHLVVPTFTLNMTIQEWQAACEILKKEFRGYYADNKQSSIWQLKKNLSPLAKDLTGYIDQNVWASSESGDLLISTKKNETLHLKNNTIQDYDVLYPAYDNLFAAIDVLRDMQ